MSYEHRLQSYAELFREYCTLVQRCEQELTERFKSLAEREAKLAGEQETHYFSAPELKSADLIGTRASYLAHMAMAAASVRFARAGQTRVEISEYMFRSLWEENPANLDLLELWRLLEKEYGEQLEEQPRYQSACLTLINQLNLKPGKRIEQVKDCAVLYQRVYLGAARPPQIDRDNMQSINQVLGAWQQFCEWAQVGGMFYRMQPGDEVRSREWLPLLKDKLRLQTFVDHFDYHLESSLAAQLQVFLATFGPKVWQSAS